MLNRGGLKYETIFLNRNSKRTDTVFSMSSHICGTLPRFFLMGSERHMMKIGPYGTLFEQAP